MMHSDRNFGQFSSKYKLFSGPEMIEIMGIFARNV